MSIDQSKRSGRPSSPGPSAAEFDLVAFGHALQSGDLGYQLARYAQDADIRIAAEPGSAPRVVSGTRAIWSWLLESAASDPAPAVSHLVDGGDRVAFTQQWLASDGTTGVSISTAELQDGLITTQHTILVRPRPADDDAS